jgi:hypothetical protein
LLFLLRYSPFHSSSFRASLKDFFQLRLHHRRLRLHRSLRTRVTRAEYKVAIQVDCKLGIKAVLRKALTSQTAFLSVHRRSVKKRSKSSSPWL